MLTSKTIVQQSWVAWLATSHLSDRTFSTNSSHLFSSPVYRSVSYSQARKCIYRYLYTSLKASLHHAIILSLIFFPYSTIFDRSISILYREHASRFDLPSRFFDRLNHTRYRQSSLEEHILTKLVAVYFKLYRILFNTPTITVSLPISFRVN